jgi:hypothetical protein
MIANALVRNATGERKLREESTLSRVSIQCRREGSLNSTRRCTYKADLRPAGLRHVAANHMCSEWGTVAPLNKVMMRFPS